MGIFYIFKVNGIPIDTSQNWIPIPPMDDPSRERIYVVVSDEGSGIPGHSAGLCK